MSTSQELKPIEALKQETPTLTRLMQLSAGTAVDAEAMVRQEIEYLRLMCLTKPEILKCHPDTVVLAMKSVLRKNLSLDPGTKLVYAMTRNIKIKGKEGQENTITMLELKPSCRGELSFAYQCESIKDHENPIAHHDATGKVTKVTMRIQKPSGRWEDFEYGPYDFERWRSYSHKDRGRWNKDFDANDPNFKYANQLYTSWRGGIDPEFAKAKCINRSLDKLGTNSSALPKNRLAFDPSKINTNIDPVKEEIAVHDNHTEEAQYAEVLSSSPLSASGTEGQTVDPAKL